MNYFLDVIKKYAEFSGRARRREYWMYMLFYFIIFLVLSVVEGFIGLSGILSGLFALALLLPSIGVAIRRLHDTGKTGWWLLLVFVPIIGGLVLLFFMIQDSQAGENQYGAYPK